MIGAWYREEINYQCTNHNGLWHQMIRFDRPVFILAAPRSGSTLLFETLAEAPQVWTVGGESHSLIEGLKSLNPMNGQVDSNRLDASHATDWIVKSLRERFVQSLQNRDGQEPQTAGAVRFLEKTPKNALRQPFLDRVFPDALYIWLYREPRPNISSMMEAWKTGRWVTYPRLRGWRGPAWSLLLPPGWQNQIGKPLAEICAFQWETSNRIILDDLEALPQDRWLACDYDGFLASPATEIRRICEFAGLETDERLDQRLSSELPLSRYTQSAPDPEKWRRNEAEIEPVLDSISITWQRCRQVSAG